jgi:hypothetical protein
MTFAKLYPDFVGQKEKPLYMPKELNISAALTLQSMM